MSQAGERVAVWPHLRAAFVAFHLLAVTVVALPGVGGGMSRNAWQAPTVQEEFRAWTERLRAFGLDLTVKELEDRLWSFAVVYESARHRILGPLRVHPTSGALEGSPIGTYLSATHTAQSWRMFVAPHRYPGRLVVDLDRGEGFEPLYMARSTEHEWHRAWLDHDRMRSAVFRYAWAHFKPHRRDFATFLARHAAEEFPDGRQLRVGFLRYRTRSPEEVRGGIEVRATRDLTVHRNLARFRK